MIQTQPEPITLLDARQVRKLTEAIQRFRARNELARAKFVMGIIDRHSPERG